VFLPSGDAALTRRSRKRSGLLAVVAKWSRPRKRYERQGLLGENVALEHAETNYDNLLLQGIERRDALEKIYPEVFRILDRWERSES
jgi:hypothetical protein